MNASTDKLGIIGGAGPYASALLYQSIVKAHYRAGHRQLPEMMILNYPFTRGLTLKESESSFHQLRQELQYCLNTLAQHGVNSFAIACNTLHSLLPGLDLKEMSLLAIPQLVMQAALKSKLHRLLLLGTETTLQSRLYSHDKIKIAAPLPDEQQILGQVIDRILNGIVERQDSDALSRLIRSIAFREKIEGVILGCTDLPVLHACYPLQVGPLPILDSIQIPANYFIHSKRLI